MVEIRSRKLSALRNVNVNWGNLAQILELAPNKGSVDIVLANFHVFTYFTDEEAALFADVCRVFLKSGGLVAFDFWDLEAVIASPPVEGVKSAHLLNREILRKCKPEVKNDFREVSVNFEFYSSSGFLFKENHNMFPRFLHEVRSFFEGNFEFCGSYDLFSGEVYVQQTYSNLVFFRKQ